ncbi:MAG: hypothetical protein CMH65_11270 [Nevskiales bacterium]|nr:hypothetical protein [Nevskiales bacterium]
MRNQAHPSTVRPPTLTPNNTSSEAAGACRRDAAPGDTTIHSPTRRATGAVRSANSDSATQGGTTAHDSTQRATGAARTASEPPARSAELGADDRRALFALLANAKARARRPKMCCASCSCSLDERRGWHYRLDTTGVLGADERAYCDLEADRARLEAREVRRAEEELFGPTDDEADERPRQAEDRPVRDDAEAEEEEEAAPVRVHLDPGKPTQREVEAHRDASHIPYRLWCPECVAGRGTGEQHRARPDERRIPVFGFDYLLVTRDGRFLARDEVKEADAILLKVVVAKDSHSKAIFAHAVRHKGVSESRYAADCLVHDLKWLGYSHVSLKSDNEPAILALLKESLIDLRVAVHDADADAQQVVQEEHPTAYDKGSNGLAEGAVKTVQGMTRTLKLDLENRLQRSIPSDHPLIHWLVEHVAWQLTTRMRGKDGQTAHQRARGRAYAKRQVRFAERILYKLPTAGPRAPVDKLQARWEYGYVLGYNRTSNDYRIYSESKQRMVSERSIQRLAADHRWKSETLETLAVTPQDLVAPSGPRVMLGHKEPDEGPETVKGRGPKRVVLFRRDFDPENGGYGYTGGCARCEHAARWGWGRSTLPHSKACVERISAELAKTPAGQQRLQAAEERATRWCERYGEKLMAEAKEGELTEEEKAATLADAAAESVEAPPPFRPLEKAEQFDNPAADDGPASAVPRGSTVAGAGGTHGDASPNTDDDGGTTSAMDMDERGNGDDDMEVELVEELKQACRSEKDMVTAIDRHDGAILALVKSLGGDTRRYRCDRRRALKKVVSEIFSPPRVTAAAKLLPGMRVSPGLAMDLTTTDEQGVPWDFTKAERRAEARQRLRDERPFVLVGSPPCTPYCTWQALNASRPDVDLAALRRRRAEADVHMAFVCELYRDQVMGGRYFLHENPAHAHSWSLECIQEILALPGVERVESDQCQYGQTSIHGDPVRKPTGWMSNSPRILTQLGERCYGRNGRCTRRGGGRHQLCTSAHARRAAVYPFELCRAILTGCRDQLRDEERHFVGMVGIMPRPDAGMTTEQLRRRVYRQLGLQDEEELESEEERAMDSPVRAVTENPAPAVPRGSAAAGPPTTATDDLDLLDADGVAVYQVAVAQQYQFRDNLTGQPLDPSMVRAARRKELEYFNSKLVWELRPRHEAKQRQGKPPISVRWVDVNKGDDVTPNYRSRLVAREIRRHGEEPIFAPTPPLESLRTVLSFAATDLDGHSHVRDPTSSARTQVSFIDIVRAYFCAATDPNDPTYVELPEEHPGKQQGLCGMLLKHMYGTRKAADGWHCESSGALQDLGFEVGDASACVFVHHQRRLHCSVYGDDLTTSGPKRDLDWFKAKLEEKYELVESARLGPGHHDSKEARVLNRVVRWTNSGLEYEADPRQAERLVRDLKLEGAKALGTPGVKATLAQVAEDTDLAADKQSPFRAVAARANYLASDRPETQYAAKEACRWMAKPTELAMAGLKRLGRYLEGHKRLVFKLPWQQADRIDIYSDTDWAGCPRSRKSTSGGCVMLGRHLIKSWSSTQALVSLSSGEAEFYGVVKASGVGLGYQALLNDLGVDLPLRVWTDSTATMGICGRQGLGKLRHLDTQCLWVQQRVRDRSFELRKVRGDDNPADLFTKHLTSAPRVKDLLQKFGCEYAEGRAESAPKLREATGTSKGEMLAGVTSQDATGDIEEYVLQVEQEALTVWNGHTFPTTTEDEHAGMPDAFPCRPGVLPHHHHDITARFPQIHSCAPLDDDDPPDDDSLEARGRRLGATKPRRAPPRATTTVDLPSATNTFPRQPQQQQQRQPQQQHHGDTRRGGGEL